MARPTWTEFHDGFAFGEDYPKSYNSLAAKKVKKMLEEAKEKLKAPHLKDFIHSQAGVEATRLVE